MESFTTTNFHGCMFAPEGAEAAASMAAAITSSGTGSLENSRTVQAPADLVEELLRRRAQTSVIALATPASRSPDAPVHSCTDPSPFMH